jgi:hypothetical protein
MRRLVVVVLVLGIVALTTGVLAWVVRQRELPVGARPAGAGALGVFHVHSEQSHDSNLSLTDIITAAERDDLDFVVLTDHNQQYAGPVTREGITVLSAAELSTPFGHLIQLGVDRVLPEAQRASLDLLGNIRLAGGVPIIAHPGDTKRPWEGPLEGAGGFEIANFAASTRRVGGPAFLGLVPTLLAMPLSPRLALAQLYDRDVRALQRWEGELDPSVIGLCGVDAHGWLDAALNLAAWKIALAAPLPAAPAERPSFIVDELRHGRFTCVAGLAAGDLSVSFAGYRGDTGVVTTGATVPLGQVDALRAELTGAAPDGLSLVLFRNGEAIYKHEAPALDYPTPVAGSYRVEVWREVPGLLFGASTVPVAYTNRLRLLSNDAASAEPTAEGQP